MALSSHHMFVMGDLNFRTKFDGENNTHEENIQRARALIQEEDWYMLYKFDELHRGIDEGDLLVGFQTEQCDFNPTFKVQRKEGFEYTDQRTPSYTDRILHKSAPNLGWYLKPLTYEPCVDFITSDHKPIRGAFSLVPNDMIEPKTTEGRFRLTFSDLECSDLLAGDVEGSSDPYIMFIWDSVNVLEQSKSRFLNKGGFLKTRFKSKTLNPKWPNKKIIITTTGNEIKAEAMLYVCVFDYDFLKDDDMLGTLPLSFQQLVEMRPDETLKELSFDRPLERYGKYGGRIKFKLNVSMLIG